MCYILTSLSLKEVLIVLTEKLKYKDFFNLAILNLSVLMYHAYNICYICVYTHTSCVCACVYAYPKNKTLHLGVFKND